MKKLAVLFALIICVATLAGCVAHENGNETNQVDGSSEESDETAHEVEKELYNYTGSYIDKEGNTLDIEEFDDGSEIRLEFKEGIVCEGEGEPTENDGIAAELDIENTDKSLDVYILPKSDDKIVVKMSPADSDDKFDEEEITFTRVPVEEVESNGEEAVTVEN